MEVTKNAGGSDKLSLCHLKKDAIFTTHISHMLKLINYH